jgi:hypothetical protein
MIMSDYTTRRAQRPPIKRLGKTAEAQKIQMKPAGPMKSFPARKVKPKKGIIALRQAEKKIARKALTRTVLKKILGRAVPVLGLAADTVLVGKAAVEGYKAIQAHRELRDLESALKKKSRKEIK